MEKWKKAILGGAVSVLGSPLWRPLHDILIDWNTKRASINEEGMPQLAKLAKGENNIKAVETMIEVIAKPSFEAGESDMLQRIADWARKHYWVSLGDGKEFYAFLKSLGIEGEK